MTADTEATGKNGKSASRDEAPRRGGCSQTVGLVANERPMNNVMCEKSRLRRLCAYT